MKKKYFMTGFLLTVFLVSGVLVYKKNVVSYELPTAFAFDAKTKGSQSPKVTLVEYSDFQCPACKKAMPIVQEFTKKYQADLQVVYKHFPLSGHQWSSLAHQCAECSASQGKFWEFHDKLFETQDDWSGPEHPGKFFLQYAKDMGLDLDQFVECLSDEKVRQDILKDKESGMNLQVRSTPTFFINEERFVGSIDLEKDGEAFIRKTLGLEEEINSSLEQ
jgi:protein-disulfide isomerase